MNAIAQAEADALRGDIEHHFCGGVYAKSIHFKRGDWAQQHVHSFEHMSIVASGFVTVTAGGTFAVVVGPLVDGSHSVSVTVMDVLLNASVVYPSLVVDMTGPALAVPRITASVATVTVTGAVIEVSTIHKILPSRRPEMTLPGTTPAASIPAANTGEVPITFA